MSRLLKARGGASLPALHYSAALPSLWRGVPRVGRAAPSLCSRRLTTTNSGAASHSSVAGSKGTPWKFVLFSDLHVSAATIDRCIATLGLIRDLSREESAPVVFLGDFWHHRHSLQVRHVDRLLQEFQQWSDEGVRATLIPGNHDQVSVDGLVHGISMFGLFPNISIATRPIYDASNRLAFLPWREDSAEQQRQFAHVRELEPLVDSSSSEQTPGWTIFAHAEVGGAVANGGHIASGRISRAQIEQVARACYVGHYHKRQLIGDRIWYVGSPFEQNFGEMNEPHGVAVVSSESIVPRFVNFDQMPKHWKFSFPADFQFNAAENGAVEQPTSAMRPFELVRPHDIVEVSSSHEGMRTEAFERAMAELTEKEVLLRRIVKRKTDGGGVDRAAHTVPASDSTTTPSTPNVAAEGYSSQMLDHFVQEYIDITKKEVDHPDRSALVDFARTALSEVAHQPNTIRPIGKVVSFKSLSVEDFCAIKGRADLDFTTTGMALLRGPMGVGKTSLGDALTWCLYGNTTPRKPGTAAASLRGDEVIHDDAKEVSVTLHLEVDGKPLSVSRSKRKGAGAKVKIEGIEEPEGVRDQQMLVNNIVGLDFDMWRMCVYLGQGAVSNFVTDADKRRKELLSRTLNLGACTLAQKTAKDQKKKLELEMEKTKIELAKAMAAHETWTKIDYDEQARAWVEENRKAVESAEAKATELQQQLDNVKTMEGKEEKEWMDKKQSVQVAINQMNKVINDVAAKHQTTISLLSKRLGQLQAEQLASAKEKKKMEDEIHRRHPHSSPAQETTTTAVDTCNTCGQPISSEIKDRLVADLRQKVAERESLVARLAEELKAVDAEMAAEKRDYAERRQAGEKDLDQLHRQSTECTEKLTIAANMRNNRRNVERALSEAAAQMKKLNTARNPFEEQKAEKDTKVRTLLQSMAHIKSTMDSTDQQLRVAEFWDTGFGPKGIPVTALSAVLHELEDYANHFLSILLQGKINCTLSMEGDDLQIDFHEFDQVSGKLRSRSFTQLSGGQRRCAELAFSPFALSEMVFNRSGVRIPFLIVDEMTTHLDPATKPLVCEVLRRLGKETVLVIDHDPSVQGEFDRILDLARDPHTGRLLIAPESADAGTDAAVAAVAL